MSFAETAELAPGYAISRVIRGGWQLAGGHGAVDQATVEADLMAYYDAGITTFDCADIYQEHGYLVHLTKGRDAKVQVFEVFGRPPTDREPQWAPETVLRCEAARDVWDVVSPEARTEFNRRLKLEGKPAGRSRVPGVRWNHI